MLQQIKSEESQVSEMEQPRKYRFVSERDLKVDHAELTMCNPELLMTMLNQCEAQGDLPSNLFLYNSEEDDSNDSSKSLKRSQATINLLKSQDDTVISTAEEHQITCIKVESDFKKMKPKSTSSTTSLWTRKKINDSITFNVNSASTPKKVFHRTSAIRKAIRKQPLTSTLIKSESKKLKIPPPLLSSSIVPDVKVVKRARSGSLRKERKNKIQKLNECCQKCERKLNKKPNFQNLKYPIKFCPNLKSKDIDRIQSECIDSLGYENNLLPCAAKSNCYGYGEYNVWFL